MGLEGGVINYLDDRLVWSGVGWGGGRLSFISPKIKSRMGFQKPILMSGSRF